MRTDRQGSVRVGLAYSKPPQNCFQRSLVLLPAIIGYSPIQTLSDSNPQVCDPVLSKNSNLLKAE